MRLIALLVALAAALLGATGCNSRRGQAIETRPYGGVEQGSLLAWAWGGAPGFEDDGPHDVVVLFDLEPADSRHRLASCNPAESDCKALRDFSDTGLEAETDASSLFGSFDTGVEEQDRLYLVVADRGNRLATSEVIVANVASAPTRFSKGELRFDRAAQQLSWPRVPDSDLFVVTITETSAERPVTAIGTRRKSWVYPELQGLVRYFHDPSTVRDLRPGGRYVATLYAVNKQGWATTVSNAVLRP
jgi:hypothetical protein